MVITKPESLAVLFYKRESEVIGVERNTTSFGSLHEINTSMTARRSRWRQLQFQERVK